MNKVKHEDLMAFSSYNPWVNDSIPPDFVIENCTTIPNVALATFRLVLGIPGDTRVPPDLTFTYSRETVSSAFQTVAGHKAPIFLCGVC